MTTRYNKPKLTIAGYWSNPYTNEKMPVVDATVPTAITVMAIDWEKGTKNNIRRCAFARGIARSIGINPDDTEAVNASGLTVYTHAAHIPQPDHKLGTVLMRYMPPNYAELWDKGRQYKRAMHVVLRPPSRSNKLIVKREDSRRRGDHRVGKGPRKKRRYAGRNERRQNIGWVTNAHVTIR